MRNLPKPLEGEVAVNTLPDERKVLFVVPLEFFRRRVLWWQSRIWRKKAGSPGRKKGKEKETEEFVPKFVTGLKRRKGLLKHGILIELAQRYYRKYSTTFRIELQIVKLQI
jgi:hypothetical protein